MSSKKSKDKQPHFYIYTDGSALGNPGPGGYAFAMKQDDHLIKMSKGYFLTTNNRMEIMGVVAALDEFGPNAQITIYTDSMYVINAATKWMKGWIRNRWISYQSKQPVKNKDLLLILNELLKKNKVKFVKVPAHCGIELNEICDQEAKLAASKPELHDTEYVNSTR